MRLMKCILYSLASRVQASSASKFPPMTADDIKSPKQRFPTTFIMERVS